MPKKQKQLRQNRGAESIVIEQDNEQMKYLKVIREQRKYNYPTFELICLDCLTQIVDDIVLSTEKRKVIYESCEFNE
jgi:hypothetical protein